MQMLLFIIIGCLLNIDYFLFFTFIFNTEFAELTELHRENITFNLTNFTNFLLYELSTLQTFYSLFMNLIFAKPVSSFATKLHVGATKQ